MSLVNLLAVLMEMLAKLMWVKRLIVTVES